LGDIVVKENLGSHQVKCLRETIDATGAGHLYLAPYSLDFNPIENTFAKLIALLRKAAERTAQGLPLLSAFTPRECTNYFAAAAGYDLGDRENALMQALAGNEVRHG